VFIAFGFNQRHRGSFLRLAKANRNEMDGADSDGVIGELAGIHRFWFQPKAWRGIFCDQLKQTAMKWMMSIAIVSLAS